MEREEEEGVDKLVKPPEDVITADVCEMTPLLGFIPFPVLCVDVPLPGTLFWLVNPLLFCVCELLWFCPVGFSVFICVFVPVIDS